LSFIILLAPSIAASVSAGYAATNVKAFKKSQQYNMVNTILADLNTLEAEIPKIYQLDIEKKNKGLTNIALDQLVSRIFNKLDWLSFLINDKQVKDKSLKRYAIPLIKEYYETTFKNYATARMKEPTQFKELKKLYEEVKDKSY